jgi:hypothetical protein
MPSATIGWLLGFTKSVLELSLDDLLRGAHEVATSPSRHL